MLGILFRIARLACGCGSPCYFVMTPQARRPPLFPMGSVLLSSAAT